MKYKLTLIVSIISLFLVVGITALVFNSDDYNELENNNFTTTELNLLEENMSDEVLSVEDEAILNIVIDEWKTEINNELVYGQLGEELIYEEITTQQFHLMEEQLGGRT